MDEFVDSTPQAGDTPALVSRLAADGYLFFRGLLPPGPVNAAGGAVFAALRAAGWVDDRGVPGPVRRALNSIDAREDPGFKGVKANPDFHRVPYLPELRTVVRRILGPRAFSYPVKVLRASYPETPPELARGRHIHQDYGVTCVRDMLTAWVPLMEIPRDLGGLAVRPRSNLGAPVPPLPLRPDEPGWATTDYRVGDVLLFHCLTSHAALPNHLNWLRVSTDFRYQAVDEVAPHELIFGPTPRRFEIYTRLLRYEPWWEPVPAEAVAAPLGGRRVGPPQGSRFFELHPGWANWKPRGGPNRSPH